MSGTLKAMIYLIAMIIILSYFAEMSGYYNRIDDVYNTYKTCMLSLTSKGNIAKENKLNNDCYDAQSKTKTQFYCNQSRTNCWIEEQ